MLGSARRWFVDRFGLRPIQEHLLHRHVPKAPWYYGDGATLMMLLVIQVITGAFMTVTYAPTPDAAYQSVQTITHHQVLGWFLRGLHYWCAGLMVVLVIWHMLRQVLVAGYKSPREGTWLIGVVMLFLVMVMGFTGYLLRWDERAIYGLRVAMTMFYNLPWIGEELVVFVQGGREMGQATLTRLYSVHVIFTPLLLGGLAGWHLYLVVLRGITSPAERRQLIHSTQEQKKVYKAAAHSEGEGELFHPGATFKSGRFAMVTLAIAVTLTVVLGPRELMAPGNLVTESAPAEEWWFWWYSALIALVPASWAPAFVVLFPLTVFIGLMLLPFVDRSPRRGMRKRPWAVILVAFIAISLIVLSDLRRRSAWTGYPRDEPPAVPEGVELTPEAEQGRLLFATYGCNSCHAVAGEGPKLGPDLARLDHRNSIDAIRAYILQPPQGVAMPAYAGHIPEEALELVTQYVHVAQTFPRTVEQP